MGTVFRIAAMALLPISLAACGKGISEEQAQNLALRMNLPETGGRVAGALLYPAEEIPDDLMVCAGDLSTGDEICNFIRVENNYLMDLPPGDFVLWAQTEEMPGILAYYTRAVECGLTPDCTDHSPLAVSIEDGTVIDNVDLGDWFAF